MDADADASTSSSISTSTSGEQGTPSPERETPPEVAAAAPVAFVRTLRVVAPAPNSAVGRRSDADNAVQGRVVRTLPDPNPSSLAIAATVRHAAMRDPHQFTVTRDDLHQQIRKGKTANLIILVVDASGSMAAQQRMQAVKGAVLALLTDAYERRDEIAVISFRGDAASVLLAPTRSVDLAQQGLHALPTGGRTPLPHALQLALQTIDRHQGGAPALLVLLTDGKANVGIDAGDPWQQSLMLASQVAERAVAALVLDTESGYLRLGRAAMLAQALGAECLTLEQLSAESLTMTIRSRLHP